MSLLSFTTFHIVDSSCSCILFPGSFFYLCALVPSTRISDCRCSFNLTFLLSNSLVNVYLSHYYISSIFWRLCLFCSPLYPGYPWESLAHKRVQYLLSGITYLRLEVECKNTFLTTLFHRKFRYFLFFSTMPVVLISNYYFKNKYNLSCLIIVDHLIINLFYICKNFEVVIPLNCRETVQVLSDRRGMVIGIVR